MRNIRRAAVAAFLILLAAILVRLIAVRSPEPGPGQAEPFSESGWLERKIGTRHSEFSGGRESFRLQADSSSVGEDGLRHLDGNVEIIDFGRKGGREVVISAGHAVFNEAQTWFEIFESVSIREGNVLVESPGLKYDRIQEVFHTQMGASFATGRIRGTARNFRYALGPGELELQGDVDLKSVPESASDIPLVVTAGRLIYWRNGTGELTVEPVLTRGRSRVEAARMVFTLSDDTENLESVFMENDVKAIFAGPGPDGIGYRVESDEARTVFHPETLVSSHFEAKGNSLLFIQTPGGGSTRLVSDYSILYFTPEGELKDLAAWPEVLITMEEDGESGPTRRLSAARVNYNHERGVLVLNSAPGRRARADSGHMDIEADRIVINLDTDNIDASGQVRLILRTQESDAPVGFFSGGQPVFITCGRMNRRAAEKRLFFREGVRVWQDRESVSAEELNIMQETGRVLFRGDVHSHLFRRTADDAAEEERLEMSADEMVFIPENNLIRYTGSGRLETEAFLLRAESLAVALAGSGGAMERVEARGKVVIDQEARQGRGEQAVYERASRTVVLTGNPVLAERDKGETKGDKLTFHLGDGRIEIENIRRDRSTTVIIR